MSDDVIVEDEVINSPKYSSTKCISSSMTISDYIHHPEYVVLFNGVEATELYLEEDTVYLATNSGDRVALLEFMSLDDVLESLYIFHKKDRISTDTILWF